MLSRVRRGMLLAGLTAAVFGSAIVEVAAGPTVDAIKRAGVLTCGVSTGVTGWSQPDSQGRWAGFEIGRASCRERV